MVEMSKSWKELAISKRDGGIACKIEMVVLATD